MYALPKTNFFDAIKSSIIKYATFKGRTRRSEYWFFMLAVNVVTVLFLTLFLLYLSGVIRRKYYYSYNYYYSYGHYYNDDAILALGILLGIHISFITLPTLAATARRLHDSGKPGEMMFIGFVPFFGGLTLLIFLCSDSDKEDNEYGPSPKYTNAPPQANQPILINSINTPLINSNPNIQMTDMNPIMTNNNIDDNQSNEYNKDVNNNIEEQKTEENSNQPSNNINIISIN